jgi:DNA polymerase eta
MRGDEARKLCPDLQIVQVPTANGKADLTAYRAAGKEVRTKSLL